MLRALGPAPGPPSALASATNREERLELICACLGQMGRFAWQQTAGRLEHFLFSAATAKHLLASLSRAELSELIGRVAERDFLAPLVDLLRFAGPPGQEVPEAILPILMYLFAAEDAADRLFAPAVLPALEALLPAADDPLLKWVS